MDSSRDLLDARKAPPATGWTRRRFLGASAAGLLAPMLLPLDALARGGRPPNIVLILADDLGYGHLGCYGQRRIRTPRLDRMAAEGVRFRQFYSGSPVCAPSRAVLMTGRHMGNSPLQSNRGGVALPGVAVTMAEILKIAGYKTGCFGKWGLGEAGTDGTPTRQGFDEFFGYLHQVHAHFHYPAYLWHNDRRVELAGNSGRTARRGSGPERRQYAPDVINGKALDFIRENRKSPFFCFLPTTLPHLELLVPHEAAAPYLEEFEEEKPFRGWSYHYAPQAAPRATLAGMISRMDRHVGQVLDHLRVLGLEEDTLVIFTSDNGAHSIPGIGDFFEHNRPFRGGKRTLAEGGIRVPMIARWPGHVDAGRVSDWVGYAPDFLPTFAELAGAGEEVHLAAPVDGVSMVPELIGAKRAGRRQPRHEYLYWEWRRAEAVRSGRWKLWNSHLYDLRTDPGETNDLAADHPHVVRFLKRYMKQQP